MAIIGTQEPDVRLIEKKIRQRLTVTSRSTTGTSCPRDGHGGTAVRKSLFTRPMPATCCMRHWLCRKKPTLLLPAAAC